MLFQTSAVNVSCASSWPPLNPMENNKYKAMNLEVLAGISKSLLMFTENMPNKKNSRAGLERLSVNN
jgi:hypothetical protein